MLRAEGCAIAVGMRCHANGTMYKLLVVLASTRWLFVFPFVFFFFFSFCFSFLLIFFSFETKDQEYCGTVAAAGVVRKLLHLRSKGSCN